MSLGLQDNTLNLILRELGRTPDKVLIPTESNLSINIHALVFHGQKHRNDCRY